MRKGLLALAATLVATSLATPSVGAAGNRTETEDYTMSNGMVVFDSTEAHWTIGTAYQVFRARPGERLVSFSIADDTGQAVRGHIHMDMDNDGKLDHAKDFCSETPKPLEVRAGQKIEVGVLLGQCPDGSPSIVTEGTITATFLK